MGGACSRGGHELIPDVIVVDISMPVSMVSTPSVN